MIVIENDGKLAFTNGTKNISVEEGFTYLDEIYKYEPSETRKVIDNLKQKYLYNRSTK